MKAETRLVLPNTDRFAIRNVTASPAGGIIVTATAVSSDEKKAAAVLIWLNPKGGMERVVRTAPFGASHVIVAPDGHVWALGLVLDPDGKNNSNHDILREYGPDGQLLHSYLNRSSFGPRHPVGAAALVMNQDRLGVYSESAGEYVEMDWRGSLIGRWKLPATTQSPGLTKSLLKIDLNNSTSEVVQKTSRTVDLQRFGHGSADISAPPP